MKILILLVAFSSVGLWLFTLGSSSPVHSSDDDSSNRLDEESDTGHAGRVRQPVSGLERSEASREQAENQSGQEEPGDPLAWRDKPELVELVAKTLDSKYSSYVDEQIAAYIANDMQGTKWLQEASRGPGSEYAEFRIQYSDFNQLDESEKMELGNLLKDCSRFAGKYGSTISDDLDAKSRAWLEDNMRNRSLRFPPELVLDSLGLSDRLEDPEFRRSVQDLRTEMMRLIVPLLAEAYHLEKFSLMAGLENGIPIEEFLKSDTGLVAPAYLDLMESIKSLNIEYYDRCRLLARAQR